jgi:hypothetical protein
VVLLIIENNTKGHNNNNKIALLLTSKELSSISISTLQCNSERGTAQAREIESMKTIL